MKVSHVFKFEGSLVDISNKQKFTFNIYIKNIDRKGKQLLYSTTDAIPDRIEIEDTMNDFYFELEFELITSKIFGPETGWHSFYITNMTNTFENIFNFSHKKITQLFCPKYDIAFVDNRPFEIIDPITGVSTFMKAEYITSAGIIKFSQFVNNYNHKQIINAKNNNKKYIDIIKVISTDYCHRHIVYFQLVRKYFLDDNR